MEDPVPRLSETKSEDISDGRDGELPERRRRPQDTKYRVVPKLGKALNGVWVANIRDDFFRSIYLEQRIHLLSLSSGGQSMTWTLDGSFS